MDSPYGEINSQHVRQQYFHGPVNRLIRYYVYLRAGLDLLNDFKYLGAGILAIFYLLKLEGYGWMILMAAVSLPILTVIGFFWTHKGRKTTEYIGIRFGSHFDKYRLEMQEKQISLLKDISEKLGDSYQIQEGIRYKK